MQNGIPLMRDDLPDPPACPTWCETTTRDWTVDLGMASHLCQCALPAGTDADGHPVTVTVRRYASFDAADGLDVADAMVRVEVAGDLGRLAALYLANRLVEAVGLIGEEQTAGRCDLRVRSGTVPPQGTYPPKTGPRQDGPAQLPGAQRFTEGYGPDP